jgi:hypothetical protein
VSILYDFQNPKPFTASGHVRLDRVMLGMLAQPIPAVSQPDDGGARWHDTTGEHRRVTGRWWRYRVRSGGGATKGATDAIVDDRRRSKGDGGPAGCSEAVGATVRSGGGATVRTGGGGLPEEDREAVDSDKSKSDWETTRRDLWCLTIGVACLAPARLVSS